MSLIKSRLITYDGMTPVLRRINKAMSLMIGNMEAVRRSSNRAVNTVGWAAARREMGAINALLDGMEAQYRQINAQQEKLNQKLQAGVSGASGLLGKLKSVAGAYLGFRALSSLVELSDTKVQTSARLNLIVDDGGSVSELEQKILLSAERARASYQTTADAISKIGMQAGAAFSSNNELIAFTELLNKTFVIAGTSSQGIDSVMLQLTQALAAGRLQGEELNAVLDNAQPIVANIQRYLEEVKGIDAGNIKELASEGVITAEIIKNAMFYGANEIETQFNAMPRTWVQIWTSMKNFALLALDGVLQKLNTLANDQRVQRTVAGMINAFAVLASAVLSVLGVVAAVYTFFADNWSLIAPIVGGITAAVLAYNAALLVNTVIQKTKAAIEAVAAIAAVAHGKATVSQAAATAGLTSSQIAFNAALLACPITWIILAIIAVIALIYLIIGAINKCAGTSISATGVIFGVITSAIAFIYNLFLALVETILGRINDLVNPFIDFANFIGNVFANPVSSVIYLFQGMADNVLAMIQKVASAIDMVFGSDLADSVQGWRDGLKTKADELVQKYAPEENYQEVVKKLDLSAEGLGLKRWAYSDAWSTGYGAGEKLAGSLKNSFSLQGVDMPSVDQIASLSSDVGGILDATSSMAAETSRSSEELAYLRDLAERESINRFTTAEVRLELTSNNHISSDMDIDGVVSYFTDSFVEALSTAAEGVHDDGI